MVVPSPMRADGCTCADRVDEGGAGLDGEQQFGLGDQLAVHGTPRPAPWPAATASVPSVTSRSQAIAGKDVAGGTWRR